MLVLKEMVLCVYLKTIEKTILEPLGILLLSRSDFAMKKALHPIITESETLHSTDSSACLSWIKNTKTGLIMLFNIESMQVVEILL